MFDFYYGIVPSPFGYIELIATDHGLLRLELNCTYYRPANDGITPAAQEILDTAAIQFHEYFCRTRKKFTIPLDPEWNIGLTQFYRNVLATATTIPYGKTTTYGAIANQLGRPNASQATGTALKLNPLPIIIPCHRVVAAHGWGGYSGGIPFKQWLLSHEQQTEPIWTSMGVR